MKIPGLGTLARAAHLLVFTEVVPSRRRTVWLRRLGYEGVHPSAVLSSGVIIASPGRVVIGEGCFLNREVFIDGEGVVLGKNVSIGPRAMLVTATHRYGESEGRAGAWMAKGVVVEDGCWIGAGAIILPGVRIGPGCVIAAGAVVVKDCESNGLYVGVPARRVKELHSGGCLSA